MLFLDLLEFVKSVSMKYKKMIEDARSKGTATEQKMWESVANIDGLLGMLEKEHPDLYKKFMREQYELLMGPHYNEEWAEDDLKKLKYKDANGNMQTEPHWTKSEVVGATNGLSFPAGTTDCDKYVAYNSMYADMNRKFTDAQILDAAYLFYFSDDDAPAGKVWRYIGAMSK